MKAIISYIKNNKFRASMLAALLAVSGYLFAASGNDEPGVEAAQTIPVQMATYSNGTLTIMEITSLVDTITINSFQVNRGNCMYGTVPLPQTLKYGQVKDFSFYKCNKVLEAVIQTSAGTYTFRFN